jgi:hypothetical protein
MSQTVLVDGVVQVSRDTRVRNVSNLQVVSIPRKDPVPHTSGMYLTKMAILAMRFTDSSWKVCERLVLPNTVSCIPPILAGPIEDLQFGL